MGLARKVIWLGEEFDRTMKIPCENYFLLHLVKGDNSQSHWKREPQMSKGGKPTRPRDPIELNKGYALCSCIMKFGCLCDL